jgi:hypothetical protein
VANICQEIFKEQCEIIDMTVARNVLTHAHM